MDKPPQASENVDERTLEPDPLPARWRRFVAARLSPEGEFGLYLTVGLALILFAALAFGELAEDVVDGDTITVLDVQLAHWFHMRATPGFTRVMFFITHWNGIVGSGIMGALLALWLWRRRARYWLIVCLIAVPGGMLLNVALKNVFQRARPSFDEPLVSLATYSFPSGHTAAATVFYGLLACYLLRGATSWRRRVAVAAAGMVALVALSRMVLGAHYLSDVLAATLESCAWLAVCITAVSALHRRRLARGKPSWSRPRHGERSAP
ncbi:phosphatase PAP2 family protein [Massilia forsythiae]|uniref:Phosphatase PAP2 family protein n=1 Tax=Massilia forsythiae TaxID=2728020 RepID=A0A7Z2W191_9BURK|nr:phosphatase PAP2 family protein [Massilia forsythiae]QJE03019.1 phosphatase PAP2 family protein [Massilia forsythiae]